MPAVKLPKLAFRGGFEHIGYGLYRMTDFVPGDNEQFAEAPLRAGEHSYLRGETVPAFV